jgi:hypothetical protein
MIEDFTGDMSRAVFVADANMLTRLATTRDTSGYFPFPDVGPRGGQILGIPAISTRSSPASGSLCLLDPGGIAVAIDDVSLKYSNQATVSMINDPDGDTPVPVDLFSNDLTAMKVVASANWETQVAGSVSLITGGSW